MELIVKHNYVPREALTYYQNHAEHYRAHGHTPYLLANDTDGLALCIECTPAMRARLRDPDNDPDIHPAEPGTLYHWPDPCKLQCPACQSRGQKRILNRRQFRFECVQCRHELALTDYSHAQLRKILFPVAFDD